MSRGHQLKRLLQQLDVDIDEDDGQFGPSWSRKNSERTVRRAELEIICDRLEYDIDDLTVPEIRDMLRQEGITRGSKKSPESEFSSSEISDLKTAVKHSVYIDAEDIPYQELAVGCTVEINSDQYTVARSMTSTDVDASAYDSYTTVLFEDDDCRLTLLHVYNASRLANRKHGARIDTRRGTEPYTKWRQSEWIQSFRIVE